jgi:hypothetical protein
MIFLQIKLAHFGSELLVDFSSYNTQVLFVTGAIISEAHCNDNKYKYVQITHTALPPLHQPAAKGCRLDNRSLRLLLGSAARDG